MFKWFKRKTDSRMLSTLERIAGALDDIRTHLNTNDQEKEKEIVERVKEQFLRELKQQQPQKPLKMEAKEEATGSEIHIEPVSEKKAASNETHPVLQSLKEVGVKIIKYEENSEKYAKYTWIIQRMGEKFDDIAKFLKHLKSSLNTLKKKRICLRNWSDAEISSSCHLALELSKNGILDEYKYLKSPIFEMIFQTSRNPDAINFLTGDWLECYVRNVVEKHLRMQGVNYHIAANPIIMMPNGRQFEMDLIIEINDELVWIEIKSGEYKSYLSKYEEVGQLLQIPEENRFLILANEKDAICESLGRSREMNVLNLNMLKRELPAVIRNLSTEVMKAG